jgi:hypothetical protein
MISGLINTVRESFREQQSSQGLRNRTVFRALIAYIKMHNQFIPKILVLERKRESKLSWALFHSIYHLKLAFSQISH